MFFCLHVVLLNVINRVRVRVIIMLLIVVLFVGMC